MPSLGTLMTEAAGGITINVGNSGAKKPAAKDDKKKPKKKAGAKKAGGERDANRRLMDLLAHHDSHAGYHRQKAAEHHAHGEYHRLAKKDGHIGVINRQIADGHRGLVKLYHKLGDTLEAVIRRRPEDKGKKYDKASAKKEEMRKERGSKKKPAKKSKTKKRLKECLARFDSVQLTEARLDEIRKGRKKLRKIGPPAGPKPKDHFRAADWHAAWAMHHATHGRTKESDAHWDKSEEHEAKGDHEANAADARWRKK